MKKITSVMLSVLFFVVCLVGCSAHQRSGAAKGAAGGAVAGALGALVVGAVFGDSNLGEKVARGAVAGATVGAVGGTAAGYAQDQAEKERAAAEQLAMQQKASSRRRSRRRREPQPEIVPEGEELTYEELVRYIGRDNTDAIVELIRCNHEEAQRLLDRAYTDPRREIRLAALWIDAIVADDLRDMKRRASLVNDIVIEDSNAGGIVEVKKALEKSRDDITKYREEEGIPLRCDGPR